MAKFCLIVERERERGGREFMEKVKSTFSLQKITGEMPS